MDTIVPYSFSKRRPEPTAKGRRSISEHRNSDYQGGRRGRADVVRRRRDIHVEGNGGGDRGRVSHARGPHGQGKGHTVSHASERGRGDLRARGRAARGLRG